MSRWFPFAIAPIAIIPFQIIRFIKHEPITTILIIVGILLLAFQIFSLIMMMVENSRNRKAMIEKWDSQLKETLKKSYEKQEKILEQTRKETPDVQ